MVEPAPLDLLSVMEAATATALLMAVFSGSVLGAAGAAILLMAKQHSPVLTFGITLACTAAVAAVIGLQMLVGFIVGVIVTLGAAAIAGADFD